MSLVSQLRKDGVARHFLKRVQPYFPFRISLLEAPFEELDHEREKAFRKGTQFSERKFHGMDIVGSSSGRADDNYLYSTRRYPLNTANNTIGGGAVAAGSNPYFTTGINDTGASMGYFSLSSLTYQQTNMGPKGQIPKGQAYQMNELGIAFNASATVANVAQLMDVSHLIFNMQQGAYLIYHGPIANWPGGVGPYGFATTTATTTTIQGATNGVPTPASTRKLSLPRVFGPTDMFEYNLVTAANLPADNSAVALTAFTEIRLNLFGLYRSDIPQ